MLLAPWPRGTKVGIAYSAVDVGYATDVFSIVCDLAASFVLRATPTLILPAAAAQTGVALRCLEQINQRSATSLTKTQDLVEQHSGTYLELCPLARGATGRCACV